MRTAAKARKTTNVVVLSDNYRTSWVDPARAT